MARPTKTVAPLSTPSEPASMQQEVDASDLVQTGHILTNNMQFISLALDIIFQALKRTVPSDEALMITLIRAVAVEIESLATYVRLITENYSKLQTQSSFPQHAEQGVAERTLAIIDGHLAAAQKSCDAVHSLCQGSALPSAVYSQRNPIPAIYNLNCMGWMWVPPRVLLWRELERFPDVLDAMDGVFFAAQTLRRFVKEAIDAPERFLDKRELARGFVRQYTVPLYDASWELHTQTNKLHAERWPSRRWC
ncbi:hypothetical protein C8R44DRAFT_920107 [Mycena epipterygia]|nr:hypothetical protein C8R44DRAFT_920107 [Mycena epipterygia]